MTKLSRALLAALLAGGMTVGLATSALAKDKPAAAPEVAPGAPNPKDISKVGRVGISAAQKQTAAQDNAGALVTVRATEAAGGLNPTDLFYLAQMKLGIANNLKDNVALEEAVKASVASPFLPATEKPKYLRNLAALALQRKDYATATSAYEQVVALNPEDPDATLNLALLYSDQKQTPQAVAMLEKAISAKKAKGEKAPEPWYRQRLKLAYDSKLKAQTDAASVALVTDYPNAVNWYDALNLYRDATNGDDQFNLDVLSLHAPPSTRWAPTANGRNMARLALDKGYPGEAKKTLDEGVAQKKLTGTKPIEKEIAQLSASKIPNDKASLPGLEKDAAKSPNAKTALGTGDAYYGYGNYAKAAEMYRLAATKAGVDLPTANLRLGAALAMANDKAGATTAFKAVTGQRQGLANYWLIYLGQKT